MDYADDTIRRCATFCGCKAEEVEHMLRDPDNHEIRRIATTIQAGQHPLGLVTRRTLPTVGRANRPLNPLVDDIRLADDRFALRSQTMEKQLSVSEVARRIGAAPKDISDLFYRRELRDDLCPIVAGRRLIPESYVDVIVMVLKRHGRFLPKSPAHGCGQDAGNCRPGGPHVT